MQTIGSLPQSQPGVRTTRNYFPTTSHWFSRRISSFVFLSSNCQHLAPTLRSTTASRFCLATNNSMHWDALISTALTFCGLPILRHSTPSGTTTEAPQLVMRLANRKAPCPATAKMTRTDKSVRAPLWVHETEPRTSHPRPTAHCISVQQTPCSTQSLCCIRTRARHRQDCHHCIA